MPEWANFFLHHVIPYNLGNIISYRVGSASHNARVKNKRSCQAYTLNCLFRILHLLCKVLGVAGNRLTTEPRPVCAYRLSSLCFWVKLCNTLCALLPRCNINFVTPRTFHVFSCISCFVSRKGLGNLGVLHEIWHYVYFLSPRRKSYKPFFYTYFQVFWHDHFYKTVLSP